MHAVVRRSVCSASRHAVSKHPAVYLAGRRRAPRTFRTFHTSRHISLAIDSTPTSEQPKATEREPATIRDEPQEKWSNSPIKIADAGRQEDVAFSEGPPESTGNNGNGETEEATVHGSGRRRALRRKRQDGLPPIKVPAWFLKHNVRLYTNEPDTSSLVTIVYGKDWRQWLSRSRQSLDGAERSSETSSGVDDNVQKLVEHAQAAVSGMANLVGFKDGEHSDEEGEKTYDHTTQLILDFREAFNTASDNSLLRDLSDAQREQIEECFSALEHFQHSHALPHTNADTTTEGEQPIQMSAAIMEEIIALAAAGLTVPGSTKSHLNLLCPIEGAQYFLDAVVREAATQLKADVIRLDAQDLAQIAGDYIPEKMTTSNALWTLGYDAVSAGAPRWRATLPEPEEDGAEEAEEEDDAEEMELPGMVRGVKGMPMARVWAGSLTDLMGMTKGKQESSSGPLGGLLSALRGPEPVEQSMPRDSRDGAQGWNDMKVSALLASLLQAHRMKHNDSSQAPIIPIEIVNGRARRRSPPIENDATATTSEQEHSESPTDADPTITDNAPDSTTTDAPSVGTSYSGPSPRLIVQIRGYKHLNSSSYGKRILDRIMEIVQKRQNAGHRIVVIGTSASNSIAPKVSDGITEELEFGRTDAVFSSIVVTTRANASPKDQEQRAKQFDEHRRRYNFDVNARHLHNMCLRSQESYDSDNVDWTEFSQELKSRLENHSKRDELFDRIVGAAETHRIVTTAMGRKGIAEGWKSSKIELTPEDVTGAIELLERSALSKNAWVHRTGLIEDRPPIRKSEESTGKTLEQIKKKLNAREKTLMRGVIDPEKLRTTFADVHVPSETVEALKNLTTLSLKRPEAFKYGVLATDKISGLLLYGPPGTGKTLLAKAVAKESGATMLEVSGADMLEMYVGEGEKNIQAVFSLAKKLAPCVVFIDEADSIFAARKSQGQHHSHRELLNQFLKEWDGMQETTAFIMIATNRPFDIDQAALRRVPRRVLVDLPGEKDREAILRIHLKDESLDPSVSLTDIASQTPLYSGSDLKNIAVAAALAAVREENDAAAKHTGDTTYQFPEKRTLSKRHFDKALEEISASISEDMDTLGAIRKFDEKYGDRRGRKKKTVYGFSVDEKVKEDAAKVRA